MNSPDHPVTALAPVSRRRFLRWTLLGAASVTAVGAGVVAVLRRSPVDDMPVPDTLRHLSASEYHLFARALPVLLPVQGTALPAVSDIPVLETIDSMIGMLAPGVRKELAAGLTLFDHGALVSGWHGKRFVDLDDEAVHDYFERWSRGNTIQKALATVVKKFVYVAYWRDPRTWPAIEFDGPVSDRWGIPSLGNTPLPVEPASAGENA
ncbi:MAG: hypothetical protein KDH99_01330 [Alcanivoracaceae bacterium]|nr:hypothetical protein [Alcanivoracaceae bacterium]